MEFWVTYRKTLVVERILSVKTAEEFEEFVAGKPEIGAYWWIK